MTWLGYAHREGTEYGRSLAWLYWWGGDEKAQRATTSSSRWSGTSRAKDDASTVVFPLVWSFRGPTRNTTVVVPFVHIRDGSWYFNTLFPVWWSGGDDKTGRAHRMLIPFFYWERAEHDGRRRW